MPPYLYQRRHSAMLWVIFHLSALLSVAWCEEGLDALLFYIHNFIKKYIKGGTEQRCLIHKCKRLRIQNNQL